MLFQKISTKEYPITLDQIRAEYPNLSIPWNPNNNHLEGLDYCTVKLVDKPAFIPMTQKVVESDPIEHSDGTLSQNWMVVPLLNDEVSQALADARKAISKLIKAKRNELLENGGFKVDGKWYHNDTFSRTQQAKLMHLGTGIPKGTKWKTMDGSFVEMTPKLAEAIVSASILNDIAIFNHAEELLKDINSRPDPSNTKINEGWPPSHK